jgi:hypothetical protein
MLGERDVGAGHVNLVVAMGPALRGPWAAGRGPPMSDRLIRWLGIAAMVAAIAVVISNIFPGVADLRFDLTSLAGR